MFHRNAFGRSEIKKEQKTGMRVVIALMNSILIACLEIPIHAQEAKPEPPTAAYVEFLLAKIARLEQQVTTLKSIADYYEQQTRKGVGWPQRNRPEPRSAAGR